MSKNSNNINNVQNNNNNNIQNDNNNVQGKKLDRVPSLLKLSYDNLVNFPSDLQGYDLIEMLEDLQKIQNPDIKNRIDIFLLFKKAIDTNSILSIQEITKEVVRLNDEILNDLLLKYAIKYSNMEIIYSMLSKGMNITDDVIEYSIKCNKPEVFSTLDVIFKRPITKTTLESSLNQNKSQNKPILSITINDFIEKNGIEPLKARRNGKTILECAVECGIMSIDAILELIDKGILENEEIKKLKSTKVDELNQSTFVAAVLQYRDLITELHYQEHAPTKAQDKKLSKLVELGIHISFDKFENLKQFDSYFMELMKKYPNKLSETAEKFYIGQNFKVQLYNLLSLVIRNNSSIEKDENEVISLLNKYPGFSQGAFLLSCRNLLHFAAMSPRIIKLAGKLLDLGVNPFQQDINGQTAFSIAIINGNVDFLNLLIKKGIKFNNNRLNVDILSMVLYQDISENVFDFLLDNGLDINAKTLGLTILHCAILKKMSEKVKFLISKGADINARTNKKGHMPIHLAILNYSSEKSIEIVKCLIDAGCDLKVKLEGKYADIFCDDMKIEPKHRSEYKEGISILTFTEILYNNINIEWAKSSKANPFSEETKKIMQERENLQEIKKILEQALGCQASETSKPRTTYREKNPLEYYPSSKRQKN